MSRDNAKLSKTSVGYREMLLSSGRRPSIDAQSCFREGSSPNVFILWTLQRRNLHGLLGFAAERS
jgi:hypothetical protein